MGRVLNSGGNSGSTRSAALNRMTRVGAGVDVFVILEGWLSGEFLDRASQLHSRWASATIPNVNVACRASSPP